MIYLRSTSKLGSKKSTRSTINLYSHTVLVARVVSRRVSSCCLRLTRIFNPTAVDTLKMPNPTTVFLCPNSSLRPKVETFILFSLFKSKHSFKAPTANKQHFRRQWPKNKMERWVQWRKIQRWLQTEKIPRWL